MQIPYGKCYASHFSREKKDRLANKRDTHTHTPKETEKKEKKRNGQGGTGWGLGVGGTFLRQWPHLAAEPPLLLFVRRSFSLSFALSFFRPKEKKRKKNPKRLFGLGRLFGKKTKKNTRYHPHPPPRKSEKPSQMMMINNKHTHKKNKDATPTYRPPVVARATNTHTCPPPSDHPNHPPNPLENPLATAKPDPVPIDRHGHTGRSTVKKFPRFA